MGFHALSCTVEILRISLFIVFIVIIFTVGPDSQQKAETLEF